MSALRRWAILVGALSAILLAYLFNPWLNPPDGPPRQIVTLAIGAGLLVGALSGIAAFFGALMNMSFLLAGSASTNPVLFTLAVGLILAWRVAGYYGVDRYLLPALGAPWKPGALFLMNRTRVARASRGGCWPVSTRSSSLMHPDVP